MSQPDFMTLYISTHCKNCGVCVKLYPDFKDRYGGVLKIAAWAYSRDDIRKKIVDMIHCCPNGAIILE